MNSENAREEAGGRIAALRVSAVSFHYGDLTALDDVSLSVDAGQVNVLLGPNGAGKTTLFSLITRLLQPRSGQIEITGQALTSRTREALSQLGIVFQQPTLDLDLSVAQNLHYFASLHGISRAAAQTSIERELNRLNMLDSINRTVRTLNGGHRRRVELARALLHDPQLLLLDEPTVGLDIPTRREFVEYVHALASERGVGVLWATHLIDEVDLEFDQVTILHRGKIQASGAAHSVMQEKGFQSLGELYESLTSAGVQV